MSKKLLYLLCMALACGALVAACGEDDDGGGGGGTDQESGATEGAKADRPGVDGERQRRRDVCIGKDTSGDDTAAVEEVQRGRTRT